ncbi:STAS domain-containing protein [Streptomyces sp. CRN 30]|uniref:STAS domain-containing protein n=1 Tax=Streptomyces sp. CRN 30 TaxID=3075613 RepID=UPI002A81C07F|nr:STAS domain-containing protein [Streptomyces sp. CRN 30]
MTPQPFSAVRSLTPDGVTVVTLRGDIDQDVGTEVRQALLPTGTPDPFTVVDLASVSFMDTAGINALILAHRAAASRDGWIRLAACSPTILRVLDVLGIAGVMRCYPTVQDALGD